MQFGITKHRNQVSAPQAGIGPGDDRVLLPRSYHWLPGCLQPKSYQPPKDKTCTAAAGDILPNPLRACTVFSFGPVRFRRGTKVFFSAGYLLLVNQERLNWLNHKPDIRGCRAALQISGRFAVVDRNEKLTPVPHPTYQPAGISVHGQRPCTNLASIAKPRLKQQITNRGALGGGCLQSPTNDPNDLGPLRLIHIPRPVLCRLFLQ